MFFGYKTYPKKKIQKNTFLSNFGMLFYTDVFANMSKINHKKKKCQYVTNSCRKEIFYTLQLDLIWLSVQGVGTNRVFILENPNEVA